MGDVELMFELCTEGCSLAAAEDRLASLPDEFWRAYIEAATGAGPSTVGLLLDAPPVRIPEPEYYPLHMRPSPC